MRLKIHYTVQLIKYDKCYVNCLVTLLVSHKMKLYMIFPTQKISQRIWNDTKQNRLPPLFVFVH